MIWISYIDFIRINCNIYRCNKITSAFPTLSKTRNEFSVKSEFLNSCITRIYTINRFIIRNSYSAWRFKKSIIFTKSTTFWNKFSIKSEFLYVMIFVINYKYKFIRNCNSGRMSKFSFTTSSISPLGKKISCRIKFLNTLVSKISYIDIIFWIKCQMLRA